MTERRVILYGLCLVCATTGTAWADGVVRPSVGGTSSGRGGANLAHFDNGAVLLSNPAGIINVNGNGLFDLGIDPLITDLDYSDRENSTNARDQVFALPQAAVIRKSEDDRWAVGVGAFVPAAFGTRWDMNPPTGSGLPPDSSYNSLGALLKVIPGAAVRVTDRLSVGATLGLGVSHAELEGPFFFQSGPLAGTPALFDLEGTDETVTWSAGLQYQLSERTMLGLAYVSEDRFRLDGRARADAVVPGVGMLRSNFDAEFDLVWPQSAGAGITHMIDDRQRVSLDVLWFGWDHAFDKVDIKLTEASNPAIAALAGPRITDTFPLDWKDSVSVRLGYEFFTSCCEVWRIGYVHNSETVPTGTLTPYIPATIDHIISVGYGKRWGSCRLEMAYQFMFSPGARQISSSELIGPGGGPGDFSNSELKAQGHQLFLSFVQEF